MKFTLDQSDAAEVLRHLQVCDRSFVPPLGERVDLAAYAEKLATRARRIEAWRDDVLVGLIALYLESTRGFISNVSVQPEVQGQGLASLLLRQCLNLAMELGIERIELEVHADNHAALALYRGHGFRCTHMSDRSPQLLLSREIP